MHPLLELDGEIVSSSHIRGLLQAGELTEANRLLGLDFQLAAEVAHGDERGRELGFPTANLVPDEPSSAPGTASTPAFQTSVAGAARRSAGSRGGCSFIGVRPTFHTGRGELIEAYLIDFDGDLYGRTLRSEFLERLRGERRFDSSEALVEQMRLDVGQAPAGDRAASAEPGAARDRAAATGTPYRLLRLPPS